MDMKLNQRIKITRMDQSVLDEWCIKYHYLHRPVHRRSCPFGYQVSFDDSPYMPDGSPCGFAVFASIHFTKHRNLFGYDGLPTKWQVLSLSRMWLHDDLPRNSETAVIGKLLAPKGLENISPIGRDWLVVHPPRFPEQPYHIRLVVSYADTHEGHEGTIYKASNFECLLVCQQCKGEFYSTSKPVVECPHCHCMVDWHPYAVVSSSHHKNTRGSGFDGHVLNQFIYRLPQPKISFEQIIGSENAYNKE